MRKYFALILIGCVALTASCTKLPQGESRPGGWQIHARAAFADMNLYGPRRLEISPDGNQIAILVNEQDITEKHWYDLEQGKVRTILKDSFQSTAAWSPDSRALAVYYDQPGYAQHSLEIWAGDPAHQVLDLTLPGDQFGLGWQDNTHLLLAEKREAEHIVMAVDINSGARSPVASFPCQPKLTATGRAGAAWLEKEQLMVSINGEVLGYSLPFTGGGRIHSWLPGDSGLVWNRDYYDQEYHILDFATGHWTSAQVTGLWLYPQGWADSKRVFGQNAGEIMLLDLRDISVLNTGQVDNDGSALTWPYTYLYTEAGLEIYKWTD